MANCTSMMKKITVLFMMAASMSGCAILDIAPENGFPEMVDEVKEAPDLLSTEAYNFHNNPRL